MNKLIPGNIGGEILVDVVPVALEACVGFGLGKEKVHHSTVNSLAS